MQTSPAAILGLTLLLAAPTALAQEAQPAPPPLPPPTPAAAPPAPTTQVAPTTQAAPTTKVDAAPGSGGLTVVVPVAGGGTVTAVGCQSVTVGGASTEVKPGNPCPAPAAAPAPYAFPLVQPRYAPDGARKAALITAPIVYGLGAMIAGVSYLNNKSDCRSTRYDYSSNSYTSYDDGDCSDATVALIAYGTVSAIVPSIPRFVVGDAGRGLAYSAARGGSVAAAALIDWGNSDDSWLGPFLFGFAAPVSLAIVDMATTPHREDLQSGDEKKDQAKAVPPSKPRLNGIAPIAVTDRERKARGGGIALSGTF